MVLYEGYHFLQNGNTLNLRKLESGELGGGGGSSELSPAALLCLLWHPGKAHILQTRAEGPSMQKRKRGNDLYGTFSTATRQNSGNSFNLAQRSYSLQSIR